MTTLSTHVLDAAVGRPAAGLDVTLSGPGGVFVAAATTGPDGRIAWDRDLDPGTYELLAATGEWFAAAGRETFFPAVTLTVALEGEHVHVALLLSPFAYTTYQGS